MTRRLPPDQLIKSQTLATPVPRPPALVAIPFFKGLPDWHMACALAALYRLRPDLGVAPDDLAHANHLWLWPRHERYFLAVCQLLKWYGVGAQWGGD